MIYTNVPYAPKEQQGNLGFAYNKFMDALPNDEDWACFLDHDAMFTTSDWYIQMEHIIKKYPHIGAFGARTNRINSTYQLVGNIDVYNHDVSYHRKIGEHIQKKYYDDLFIADKKTAQTGFSGVVILIKKSQWLEIGGFKEGFNDVDNNLRWSLEDINKSMYIMNGVYVYHWYKANNPYVRCLKKFEEIDNKYKQENRHNFDLNNIFLYKGTSGELPL